MITKNIFIRILQQLLLFLITLLIARMVGPQGNGVVSLFITDVSFFILVISFCLDSSILYFSAKKKLTVSQTIAFLIPLFLVQVILFFVTYFFVKLVFNHWLYKTGVTDKGVIWGLIFIMSSIIFNYCNSLLLAQKIFFKVVLCNIIIQFLFLVFLLTAYAGWLGNHPVFFKTTVLIPLYTSIFVLQAVVAMALVLKNNKEKIVWKPDWAILNKEFIQYTARAYAANILQFLACRMDVWLIDHFQTKADVGAYSLSAKIAQLWWVLPLLLSNLLYPLTALEHESVNENKFKKMVVATAAVNIIAAIIAVIVFPYFIHYVVGDSYLKSYMPFVYLLPGIVLFSVNILLAARMAGKGNIVINMQASAICFFVILLLDLWLIPAMNIKGAAIATSIGYSVSTVFAIIKYRRWMKG